MIAELLGTTPDELFVGGTTISFLIYASFTLAYLLYIAAYSFIHRGRKVKEHFLVRIMDYVTDNCSPSSHIYDFVELYIMLSFVAIPVLIGIILVAPSILGIVLGIVGLLLLARKIVDIGYLLNKHKKEDH